MYKSRTIDNYLEKDANLAIFAKKLLSFTSGKRVGHQLKGNLFKTPSFSAAINRQRKPMSKEVYDTASNMRTFFGKGPQAKNVRIQEIKPSTGKGSNMVTRSIGDMASNTKSFLQNPLKYLSTEWKGSKRFTKTVKTKSGKTYQVSADRSRLGRVANPLLSTSTGIAGISLLTNKKDEQGKNRSAAGRVGNAIGEGLTWAGPVAPITGTLAMGKMLFNNQKKEKNNNGIR
jgi:hypothetical protein